MRGGKSRYPKAAHDRRQGPVTLVLDSLASHAVEVLRARPSGLLTDIDGTISRIVPRPEDATVDPRISGFLAQLASRLNVVGVITARAAAIAREMVGVEGLTYVGHYGLEETAEHPDSHIADLKPLVREKIRGLACVTLEDKDISFSIHYRNCPNPEAVREQILAILLPLAGTADARLLEGKRVVEVVPDRLPDKRSAVARLVRNQGLQGLIYMGDDLSDVAVFKEIGRRRVEDGLPGIGLAVVDAETDPIVRQAADFTVDGVDGVSDFLGRLVTSLKEEREESVNG